jgi:ureidoglycolate lyase
VHPSVLESPNSKLNILKIVAVTFGTARKTNLLSGCKMPVETEGPAGQVVLEAEPLCQESFSAFGTVVENPMPSLIPSSKISNLPRNAVQANQGSAIKYQDVTHVKDLYGSAPSKEPSKAVMNMFVCAQRPLLPSQNGNLEGLFSVQILERHPFTTQTFIPLGLSPSDAHRARYLVIVAPSLPLSPADEHLPVPTYTNTSDTIPGRGPPDLTKVKAYIATGSQAVTYGAGTWHAPMVVVGEKAIDFIVVQFANGVAVEDCQEVELEKTERSMLLVSVPQAGRRPRKGLWKL